MSIVAVVWLLSASAVLCLGCYNLFVVAGIPHDVFGFHQKSQGTAVKLQFPFGSDVECLCCHVVWCDVM